MCSGCHESATFSPAAGGRSADVPRFWAYTVIRWPERVSTVYTLLTPTNVATCSLPSTTLSSGGRVASAEEIRIFSGRTPPRSNRSI